MTLPGFALALLGLMGCTSHGSETPGDTGDMESCAEAKHIAVAFSPKFRRAFVSRISGRASPELYELRLGDTKGWRSIDLSPAFGSAMVPTRLLVDEERGQLLMPAHEKRNAQENALVAFDLIGGGLNRLVIPRLDTVVASWPRNRVYVTALAPDEIQFELYRVDLDVTPWRARLLDLPALPMLGAATVISEASSRMFLPGSEVSLTCDAELCQILVLDLDHERLRETPLEVPLLGARPAIAHMALTPGEESGAQRLLVLTGTTLAIWRTEPGVPMSTTPDVLGVHDLADTSSSFVPITFAYHPETDEILVGTRHGRLYSARVPLRSGPMVMTERNFAEQSAQQPIVEIIHHADWYIISAGTFGEAWGGHLLWHDARHEETRATAMHWVSYRGNSQGSVGNTLAVDPVAGYLFTSSIVPAGNPLADSVVDPRCRDLGAPYFATIPTEL